MGGLALVLFPAENSDDVVSEVPISVGVRWEILRFLENLDPTEIPTDPSNWLNFLLDAFNIEPIEFLQEVIAHVSGEQDDPYGHFINEISGGAIALSNDPESSLLQEIQDGIETNNIDLIQFAFEQLVSSEGSLEEKLDSIAQLFQRWLGDLSGNQLVELLVPQITAAIHELDAAVEFPRSWLIPLDDGGRPLPEPKQSRLVIKGGSLRFSSKRGLQFVNNSQLDFQKSEILQTGLTLEVVQMRLGSRETVDLTSGQYNGASALDVTVEEARIGLPASWTVDQQGANASLIGRDLRFLASKVPSGEIFLDTSTANSLGITLPGGIRVGLSAFSVTFGEGNVNGVMGGFLTIPGLRNASGDTDAKLALSAIMDGREYTFNASTPDGLRIADFMVQIDQCQIVIDHETIVRSTIIGSITIPAFELANGRAAVLAVRVEIEPDRYAIFATVDPIPQLRLSEFAVGLSAFGVEFSGTGLLALDISGALELPGVKDRTGQPAALEFAVEIDPPGYRLVVVDPPPLDLDVFDIDFTTVDIAFTESGLSSLLLGGEITIPGVQDTQGQVATIDFKWNTAGVQHTLATSNLPTLVVGGFELMLSDCDIAVSDAGLESFIAEGTFSIPGLKDPSGTPAQIGFVLGLQDDIFRMAVSSVPALHLGPLELSIDMVDLSFSETGVHSAELSGTITIPGVQDTQGRVATIDFEWNTTGGQHTLITSNLPTLVVGGFELMLSDCDIAVSDAGLESFIAEGTFSIPGLKDPSGTPAQIGFVLGLQDDIFRMAVSSVPALHLGPLELSIDMVDLSFSESGVHSAELSGRLTVPGLETEDGDNVEIQFGLKADGDVFSISAGDLDELPPLKLGELSVSLNSFEVTFGENVPFSSSIAGYIEVPFFENSAGEPLRLDVIIDLDDGFGVTTTVPGGEVTILDIADVIRVALFKLSFGYGTNGVRFAIGGRIENRLSVPMLDALVPSEITVNDLSYDPQTDDMDLDLEVAWPSGLNITQDGAGGFEVVVPVGEIGGGLSLDAVKLVFADKGGAYDFSIAFQGAVLNLGPLTGTVSGLGFVATVEPRSEGDGNLGPLQLDLGYLPVTRLGFSVDACGLGGGGFLDFDDPNKRYAGVLALDFGDIGLVAIGLITTRMPDGTDGFSMLVSITATFDPPIELSYGFTLSGVGGLIAVNRSMSTEELRKGIKTGAIDSIMFPEPSTVIANAAKIISDMRSVFPVAEGQYVIGPMLKLGWGSPVNIMVVDLGIFIAVSRSRGWS
ncbi:MAG: hypothetical protein K8S27_03775 [Candidatus Omnitrophica bacterium]|nr:hypothetical protein [Candidatus Omnitrophota bacterium]